MRFPRIRFTLTKLLLTIAVIAANCAPFGYSSTRLRTGTGPSPAVRAFAESLPWSTSP